MRTKDNHVEAAPRSTDAVVGATAFINAAMSPAGMLWRTWFERVRECATVHVVNATANLVIEEKKLAHTALITALQDLYDYQQSISSPDTRWGLPIYQRARAALSLARGEQNGLQTADVE